MWQYLLNRLSEKSTWVALGTVATAVGWKVSPQNWDTIAMVGMGLPGLISTLLPARVQEKNVSPVQPGEVSKLK